MYNNQHKSNNPNGTKPHYKKYHNNGRRRNHQRYYPRQKNYSPAVVAAAEVTSPVPTPISQEETFFTRMVSKLELLFKPSKVK